MGVMRSAWTRCRSYSSRMVWTWQRRRSPRCSPSSRRLMTHSGSISRRRGRHSSRRSLTCKPSQTSWNCRCRWRTSRWSRKGPRLWDVSNQFFCLTKLTRSCLSSVELNKVLLEHRDMMRAQNNFKFIPVTIDELMFRFCLNEKRKECE